MRRFLLTTAALCAFSAAARADLVNNSGIFPSASFTVGNCLQATAQNQVATTTAPCGSGSGGTGNVTGPTSSIIGNIAVWANGTGTAIADSAITAANIPQLGATQTWGGINTFMVRPVFNDQTPYDTGNLPGALTTALAPYLLSATAASTYLTQASAAAQYLTITSAAATYATITGVQSAYMRLDGGTFTGAVTFNLAPTYTGAATTFRGTHITTNNVLRWNLGADGAETGSSSGSDFHLYGYNDAGVFQGAAITVTRSNLTATFLNRPVFGTATPWDSLNFDPSLYLTKTDAAGIYLTQIDAAATYTTPGEVNAALAEFLTQANAAATYAPIVNPHFTNSVTSTGGPVNITGTTGAFRAINFETNGSERWMMGADNIPESGSNAGSNFALFSFDDTGNVNHTILTGNRATGLVNFGVRPTFNGATAWDSANLTPFTQTQGDARYLQLAGGTVTGAVQFNQIPTVNVAIPPVTDSSLDVATASWTQAVITNRVGTGGPFIPTSGHGMPYDIHWTTPGINVPTTPMLNSQVVLNYVFTRATTIPATFAGSEAVARAPAAATTNLNVSSSRFGLMGALKCNAGASTCQFSVSGGPFAFQPGDTLSILVTTPDTALNGVDGTILASLT